MEFSKSLLRTAFGGGVLLLAGECFAYGIPVYCYNCQESTYNAAHSILDGQRLQTEALLNGMDYIMRTSASFGTAIASGTGVTEQRVQNAFKMDPSIARPRLACSQTATAGVRSGSTGASNKLRKALVAKTQANNYRGANLPPGESRKEYSIQKVIEVLGEEGVNPAESIISGSPIPNDAGTIALHRKVKDATINPFPVELPAEEEIQRIKKKGSQGEKDNLAHSYALMARQLTAQSILDEDESNRIQFVKSDPFKDQLSYLTEGMDDDTKKIWTTGQLSNYQIEQMAADYRVLSPTWVKQISASASPEAVNKELVLEMAEVLHQLGIANKLQRQSNILAAMKESREVSNTDLQSR